MTRTILTVFSLLWIAVGQCEAGGGYKDDHRDFVMVESNLKHGEAKGKKMYHVVFGEALKHDRGGMDEGGGYGHGGHDDRRGGYGHQRGGYDYQGDQEGGYGHGGEGHGNGDSQGGGYSYEAHREEYGGGHDGGHGGGYGGHGGFANVGKTLTHGIIGQGYRGGYGHGGGKGGGYGHVGEVYYPEEGHGARWYGHERGRVGYGNSVYGGEGKNQKGGYGGRHNGGGHAEKHMEIGSYLFDK